MPKFILAVFACCAALLTACQASAPAKPAQTLLASATFTHDCSNQPIAGTPTLELSVQGDHLVLRATRQAPAQLLDTDRPGQFMPFLWQRDCAEAFLLNPDNGAYLELNLSPSGAWWACAFSAPRQRSTPEGLPLAGAIGRGKIGANAWSTELRIPLASLPKELAFAPGHTRANLCCCLGHDPQRFLSWCDLRDMKKLDFHCPDHWRTIPAK